ncbi:hypothetical protein [Hoeflea alexandrii]|uniref:Uncharacterized protein n=1 Tax=Hoeflea alexandrii TaxID=288436 RepID=A0ABT1CR63_9HYPH|nr:hypothetical protein [Hoeflea alexandrii]MCO6408035.1 hypothetical protein [Hoeflea alexandrii]MCY0153624.1 hypothetical protein [Hoeflea alexandrii]
MAILPKEALEYQRALFELPRFLFTGITIFTTAASFLIRSIDEDASMSGFLYTMYIIGIALTLLAFAFGYAVISGTVESMRSSNSSDEAEVSVDRILRNEYYWLSWSGGGALVFWVILIIGIVFLG